MRDGGKEAKNKKVFKEVMVEISMFDENYKSTNPQSSGVGGGKEDRRPK